MWAGQETWAQHLIWAHKAQINPARQLLAQKTQMRSNTVQVSILLASGG